MAKSLKAATKKSIYEARVQQAGMLGTNPAEFLKDETFTAVEKVLGSFIERVHTNINNEKGMVTTGKINDITLQADGKKVHVMGHKWLIFQDRGVNGAVKKLYQTPHFYSDKRPPVDVFKTWIKEKNIRLINNAKYKGDESPFKELTDDEKINRAAWAMSTKVYQEGFKPRNNIYSKEIPKLVEDLQKEVADFAVQALSQVFEIKENSKRVIIPK